MANGSWTDEGEVLEAYMIYRAQILEHKVKSSLMNADQARSLYESTRDRLKPIHEPPMNKQRGEKRQVAYLTALVNMHIEHELSGRFDCDYNPRRLTSVIRDNRPLRTLARRMDGAFPSVINPIAVWEIKEYYHTTTFGSRVADGIYATLLDGLELEELQEHTGVNIRHYLIVDAFKTWWEDGKSFLCRMIDLSHMGYVDEVLFGREVVQRIPLLVEEWIGALESRDEGGGRLRVSGA